MDTAMLRDIKPGDLVCQNGFVQRVVMATCTPVLMVDWIALELAMPDEGWNRLGWSYRLMGPPGMPISVVRPE